MSESHPAENRDLLKRQFGFDEFRPGQEEVLNALDVHGAALAVFPTGGGKSICYQLAALKYDGVTLVVSPLIALMKDQIDFLQRRGIAAARLDSTLDGAETTALLDRLNAGSLKLLYVAPERFNNERFLSTIRRLNIALFAVDEAHCISEWGHNFRPDYLKLAETARNVGAKRSLALTATATPTVVEDIRAAFGIPAEAAIVTGFYRPNLTVEVSSVTTRDRDDVLVERLRSRPPGATIVYVTLQKTAERVAQRLSAEGFTAWRYHAGIESDRRAETQEAWMASRDGIAVATIAFGMGIDRADVRYVYHYNLPKSLESYSQEIGRAGRDGVPSTVEVLACLDDVPTLQNFAYGDTPTRSSIERLLNALLANPEPSRSDDPNAIDVSLYELSGRCDLRPLVLRTALTYLELLGALRQGTPFYAGYEIRPLLGVEAIIGQFSGEPAALVRSLFERSRKGRTWYALDPDAMAVELSQPRKRIVKALDVLEERKLIELKVADARMRFYRTEQPVDVDALTLELGRRFKRRESQEIARLGQVIELITGDCCIVNALVGYFGEARSQRCGHCRHCSSGNRLALTSDRTFAPLPDGVDPKEVAALIARVPDALGEPRQLARFLTGCSSPAVTRAKLGRHPLFGAWEERPFTEVLTWAKAL